MSFIDGPYAVCCTITSSGEGIFSGALWLSCSPHWHQVNSHPAVVQVGVTARARDAAAERQKCHSFLRMFFHSELPPVISVFLKRGVRRSGAAITPLPPRCHCCCRGDSFRSFTAGRQQKRHKSSSDIYTEELFLRFCGGRCALQVSDGQLFQCLKL